MGIRLITLLLILCLLSCKARVSHADSLEHDYVESYKKAVLYGCLNEVTEGDFQKSLIKNNDLGLYTEAQVLFHAVCDRAKQRGENYARSIEAVSLPDAEGRRGYSHCVSYAFSKEIDSIARVEYRKLLTDD